MKHDSDLSVRFANPPIFEVAIGADFDPPPARLRSEHIGLFWARIRERFPVVEHRPNIGGVEGVEPFGEGDNTFPIPRYWFRSRDDDTMIQVQTNAFVFNWKNATGYPGFHASLKPSFDEYSGIFEDFCHKEVGVPALSVDRCSLSYINSVPQCEYWDGPKDTRRVLPGMGLPDLGTTGKWPFTFDCHYTHRAAADLTVGLRVRTAKARRGPEVWVLVFEIEARGWLGGVARSVADPWYRRAHEAVVNCFLTVTDEEIRSQFWQPAPAIPAEQSVAEGSAAGATGERQG